MKTIRLIDPLRVARDASVAASSIDPLDTPVSQRLWFNVLVAGGSDAEIQRLHQTLSHAQSLPWRAAEEVEREVVFLALRRSGRRVEALTIEDILRACEEVEERHLIEDGAVARHFRHLWSTSSAYCKHFIRGLLALKPGDEVAGVRVRASAGGLFREGFSLTRIILPPYRVLQGSYRYAGRSWCLRHWGTPEDARLVASRFEAAGVGRRLAIYEFETVEASPLGALQRLGERHADLAFSCVSVDADSGQRLGHTFGRRAPLRMEALPSAPMVNGGFRGAGYVETIAIARQAALARMAPSPRDLGRAAA